MDQQQNYLIFLIAVFLALGIGIIIGASMGENALVTNQIAVIEDLRNEIRRYKDEFETQFLSISQLKEELLNWESLEKDCFNPLLLQDKLKNVNVKVIVQNNLPACLEEFLDLCGCSYQAYILSEIYSWPNIFNEGDAGSYIPPLEKDTSLLSKTLMPILLGEENVPPDNIVKRLEEKNLLMVKTDKPALSISTVQGQTEKICSKEFIIAYGDLDLPCLDLVHKIGQEGKTILWVNAPKGVPASSTVEHEIAVPEKIVLNNFHQRLKLLEILQADN